MLRLESLLNYSIEEGASGVHISVGDVPRMRVHGKLVKTNFPVMTHSDTLEALLTLMSAEQRQEFELNGQIDLATDLSNLGRFRVNAYKQKGCITLSIRIVDSYIPSCAELNIPEPVINQINAGSGLIIICGLDGAGKSTVIASLIDYINSTMEKNIITLEDPIEYVHKHKNSMVNQREVGLDTQDYVHGINFAMKEDPDVVFINSFKDPRVINACLDGAMMNRMIITSMNVCGTKACIKKIISSYNTDERRMVLSDLSESLCAIVSRTLCAGKDGNRVPAYEICIMNKELRGYIRDGKLGDLLKAMSEDDNCILMDDYLNGLYNEALIDETELRRHLLYS